MLLINHMVLQLRAGSEQKAWQPFGDWHLVSESPSFFCSSLSAHFHPSIPSLFNWLSEKVLLSASTCPCHSKQRQLGDTVLSLFSPVSALFSPLPSSLTFFYFVSSWFSLLPHPSSPGISPFLFITLSFSLRPLFFVSLSLWLVSFSYSFLCVCVNFLAHWQTNIITFLLSLFTVIGLTEYFYNSVLILLSCEIDQNYDCSEDKMSLHAHKSRWQCIHSTSVMPFFTVKSRFLYSGLVYHVQSLCRLQISALCKSLPARTNKPGPINVNPHSLGQSMSFPLLQNQA